MGSAASIRSDASKERLKVAQQAISKKYELIAHSKIVEKISNIKTPVVIQKGVVKTKKYAAEKLSHASIEDTFDICAAHVCSMKVIKREYEVHNCGPDTIAGKRANLASPLIIEDKQILTKLVQYKWTPWTPSLSWRVKINQVFNIEIYAYGIKDSSIERHYMIKLRLSENWVGPSLEESVGDRRWLHRVDFNIEEDGCTVEKKSFFFETIYELWVNFELEKRKNMNTDLDVTEVLTFEEIGSTDLSLDPNVRKHKESAQRLQDETNKIILGTKEFSRLQNELFLMRKEDTKRNNIDSLECIYIENNI